jgi:hypothetical protein
MNQADFVLMFLLGLAGSVHCVQMCGPIVLSLDLSGKTGLRGHAAYHSGRILTYALLGALGGWVGTRVTNLVALGGFRNGAAIFAGVLMILAGLILFGAVKSNNLVQIGSSSTIARLGGRLLRSRARFATGIVLGFLPCGLLYGALFKSIATASIIGGAISMTAFGLGTAGPLLGLGAFSSVITSRFRSQKLAAIGITLMGVLLVWRGWPVTQGGPMHHR